MLIFAAVSGSPGSISAVAQTCRAFRALVYQSADQHLWREIFLTTFDDPRVGQNCGISADLPGAKKADDSQSSFDWGAEYRLRIWTERYFASQAKLEARENEDDILASYDLYLFGESVSDTSSYAHDKRDQIPHQSQAYGA